MNKLEFEEFFNSIICCYGNDFLNRLPKIEDLPEYLFINNEVNSNNILELINNTTNPFTKSVLLRLIAIFEIRNARDLNIVLDLNKVWNLVMQSILIIPKRATISSIGSQGFLSIPLFKFETDRNKFDFIRLHIWDKSLNRHMNLQKRESFSVHNHMFYATSWILCGKVINDRFLVNPSSIPTKYSIFSINYNKPTNEINQHSSNAFNTNLFANLIQISHEIYMQGGKYSINAGEFHKSGSKGKNGLSATLFSFTAKNGIIENSHVIGPNDTNNSEINRKMYIDPTKLLKKIDRHFI